MRARSAFVREDRPLRDGRRRGRASGAGRFFWERTREGNEMEKMRAHIVSRGVAIAIALLVVLTAPGGAAVRAQTETGQITGTVTDPTGAVIAGATVIVRSPDTGAERTVTTTGEGLYTVANLQP